MNKLFAITFFSIVTLFIYLVSVLIYTKSKEEHDGCLEAEIFKQCLQATSSAMSDSVIRQCGYQAHSLSKREPSAIKPECRSK
jgi:hypothetical protein